MAYCFSFLNILFKYGHTYLCELGNNKQLKSRINRHNIVNDLKLFVHFAVFNTTEDGWLIYNDSQYYINKERLPMEAARDYCRKNYGELVVITAESERKFIWKQVRNAFNC